MVKPDEQERQVVRKPGDARVADGIPVEGVPRVLDRECIPLLLDRYHVQIMVRHSGFLAFPQSDRTTGGALGETPGFFEVKLPASRIIAP